MQSRHYKDLGKRLGFPVTYAEHQEDHGGFFTSDSEYLQIIQLAQLRNITPEQQYNRREHTQDLELDKLDIIYNELASSRLLTTFATICFFAKMLIGICSLF